jgi:hypothetical protein
MVMSIKLGAMDRSVSPSQKGGLDMTKFPGPVQSVLVLDHPKEFDEDKVGGNFGISLLWALTDGIGLM